MTRTRTIAAVLASLPLAALLTIVCVSATWSQTVTIPARVGKVEIPAQTIELPPSPLPQKWPTAKELSEPGALQWYIEASLKDEGRCVLPVGVIRISEPIKLRWVQGGTIEGAGPTYAPSDSKSDWRTNPAVIQANTTIVTSDPNKPVLDLSAVIGLEVAKLSIETSGVGVLYRDSPGGGSMFNTLRKVSFHGCTIGFKAGEKLTDPNSADVTFDGCTWRSCKTCCEVNNNQGVNYLFHGLCWAIECDRFAVLNAGGLANLQGVCGMNVGTWLTIVAGGGNNQPSRIEQLYSDRTASFPPPVLVDASKATAHYRVLVDGVKVTYHGASDAKQWPDFVAFREMPNAAVWKSTITVRDPDTINWPAGVISKPTVVTP